MMALEKGSAAASSPSYRDDFARAVFSRDGITSDATGSPTLILFTSTSSSTCRDKIRRMQAGAPEATGFKKSVHG
jgi:hypothetical protein